MLRNSEDDARIVLFIKDYEYMVHILTEFCKNALIAVEMTDKQQASMRRKASKEWNFHQTLAHVTAAAEIYQQALEATLSKSSFAYPRMRKRIDLPALNDHEIMARQHLTTRTLAQNLLKIFECMAQMVGTLTPDMLAQHVGIPIFNRSITVAELLDMQIVHPGILHAAQLTNAVGMRPLWVHYTPDFMHRQITRFFQVMSLVYWPERGGDLHASINFIVAGPGGGRWSVVVCPSGGYCSEQSVQHAALTIWMRNTYALCQFMTNQESTLSALCKGKLLIWGDVRLGWKLSWLFSPT